MLVVQGGDFAEGVTFRLGNAAQGGDVRFNLSLQPEAYTSTTGQDLFSEPIDGSEWHHYAAVVDRANDRVRLYIDGDLVTDEPLSIGGDRSFEPTFDMLIGAYDYVTARNGCDRFKVGEIWIDELKIFEAVLTDEQIQGEASPVR